MPSASPAQNVKSILSRYGFRPNDLKVRTSAHGEVFIFVNGLACAQIEPLSKVEQCLRASGVETRNSDSSAYLIVP